MSLNRVYRWSAIITKKIRNNYKKYGLFLTIIHYLKLIIYKSSSTKIFYELKLENTIYPWLQVNHKIAVKKIKPTKLETLAYDDRCEMKREEAFARLKLGHALFGAIKGKTILSQQWIEFNKADLWFLGLSVSLPDRTAYISHLYTSPEYRKRGIASILELHSLKYLKDSGYKQAIAVVEEDNASAHTLYENFGFYPYQTVDYRRFFVLLTLSTIQEFNTTEKKSLFYIWKLKKRDKELLKAFSKIIEK